VVKVDGREAVEKDDLRGLVRIGYELVGTIDEVFVQYGVLIAIES
jgi:hypothetical protein